MSLRLDLGIHCRIERLDNPPHDLSISQKSDIVHPLGRARRDTGENLMFPERRKS
jgi:hypothetical protein